MSNTLKRISTLAVQVWNHHGASMLERKSQGRDEGNSNKLPSAGDTHAGNGFPLVSGPAKGVAINPTM